MVFGLAWRCRISLSVKNPCRIGASGLMTAPRTRWLEPIGGQGEQLRDGLQVPVGRLRVDVSEPGRQQRQPGLHVAAVAVEVQQGGDRERMPQVVQPRTTSPGRAAIPASSTRPAKVWVRLWTSRRVPRVETKKLGAARVRDTTGHGGVDSRAARRRWRVQEHPPRLAELRVQNQPASRRPGRRGRRRVGRPRTCACRSPPAGRSASARSPPAAAGVNRPAASMSAVISPVEYR